MFAMYIDEAGCLGSLPRAHSSIQPLICLTGLFLDLGRLEGFTREWIALKRRFFPNLVPPTAKPHDWQRAEIKGADIRKAFRKGGRNARRHAAGFLDHSVALLRNSDCRLCSRVWIKIPGEEFRGGSVYTFSVQDLCATFQAFLEDRRSTGVVIADSRMPRPNSQTSHSVFTQKFRFAGDPYPRVIEAPLFGHSDNHAALQVCDLNCSAILFPVCGRFFLGEAIESIHLHRGYTNLAERYVPRLVPLMFRYRDGAKTRGGLTVYNGVGKAGASALFARFGGAREPLP